MPRIDPNLPELRLWLSTLPAADRCAMLHALAMVDQRLKHSRTWDALKADACRGMSIADREAMLLRAMRIAENFRQEMAAAAAA